MKRKNHELFGDIRSALAGQSIRDPDFRYYSGRFLLEGVLGKILASAENPEELLDYIMTHREGRALTLSEILHAQDCYSHCLTTAHFSLPPSEGVLTCQTIHCLRQPAFEISLVHRPGVEARVVIELKANPRKAYAAKSFENALAAFMYQENHSVLKAYAQWVKQGFPPAHFGLPNRQALDLANGWNNIRSVSAHPLFFQANDTLRIGRDIWFYEEAGFFYNSAFAFPVETYVSRESFAAFREMVDTLYSRQEGKSAALFTEDDPLSRIF